MTRLQVQALLAESRWLQALARQLVRDEHGAEDAYQQTWISALESPPANLGNLRGWLYRTLCHVVARRHRSDRRRTRREALAAKTAEVPDAVEALERADLQQRVIRAVLCLSEPYRSTLLLRFFEGRSVRDIARRCDVTVNTVHSRVRRALQQIRTRLDQDFGDRRTWSAAFLATGFLKPVHAATSGVVAAAAGAIVLGGVFVTSSFGLVDVALTSPEAPRFTESSAPGGAPLSLGDEEAGMAADSAVDPSPAPEQEPSEDNTEGATFSAEQRRLRQRIIKQSRSYFDHLSTKQPDMARHDREELQKLIQRAVSCDLLAEPPLAEVSFWREVLHEAHQRSKGGLRIFSDKFSNRPWRLGPEAELASFRLEKSIAARDGCIQGFACAPRQRIRQYKSRKPVLLVFHGPDERKRVGPDTPFGGSPRTQSVQDWLVDSHSQVIRENLVILAPLLARYDRDVTSSPRNRWNSALGLTTAFRSLAALFESRTNVDFSRVFFEAGPGTGLDVARIARKFPSIAAGVIFREGALGPRERPDLSVVPYLWESVSLREGSRSNESPGEESEPHPDSRGIEGVFEDDELLEWVNRCRRQLPDEVTIQSHDLASASAFWIRCSDAHLRESPRDDGDAPAVIQVRARLDRVENVIYCVTSPAVRQIGIYLNDEALDLSREVRVMHGFSSQDLRQVTPSQPHTPNTVFRGTVRRDLTKLLDHDFYLPHGTPGEVFPADLTINLSAPAE